MLIVRISGLSNLYLNKLKSTDMDITNYICILIDNLYSNRTEQSIKESSLTKLVELGVYNEDGEMVTDNTTIINYYNYKWC